MVEIGFYHLRRTSPERALPRLLEKALARDMRALVVAGSEERARHFDDVLWTHDPSSFLPHGTAMDGRAEDQPILLSGTDDNLNGARLLVLLDSADSDRLADFERVIDMFDGSDQAAVADARRRWKSRMEAGHALAYWQQTERGGWEKKTQTGSS